MSLAFTRKINKRILLGFLVLAAAGAAVALTLGIKTKLNDNQADSAVVYEDGGAVFAFINGKKTEIEDHTADRFLFDETEERLYYTVASSFSNGTFDLYYLSPESKEPVLVDFGIQGDYHLGRNGATIYYAKRGEKSGALEGICYDLAGKQMIAFTQNPEAMYVPKSGREMYFTRLHGSTRVLYAYTPGEKPRELFRGAEDVRLFDSEAGPELLFENGRGTENESLQIVYPGEKPLLISDGVRQVRWDEYRAGGNLYYCTACNNGMNWRAVIGDSLAQQDSALAEPVRGDYLSVFGYPLGYPTAKAAYDRKVKRDEMRAALDTGFADEVGCFDVYAYNKNGSVLMAENVRSDRIKAVAPAGEPKIVFGTVTSEKTDLDITDLTGISAGEGMEAALACAARTAAQKTKNNGLQMAVLYKGAVTSYGLQGYPQTAGFHFSQDGNSLLALSEQEGKSTLFFGSFSQEQKPGDGQKIDSGITDYRFTKNGAVYMKTGDADTVGTVCRWNGKTAETLSENSNAFLVKGEVYSFKDYTSSANGDKVTADYYCCTGGREILLGRGVAVNSISAGESGHIAFLCDKGLVLCRGENTTTISEKAAQILYIH